MTALLSHSRNHAAHQKREAASGRFARQSHGESSLSAGSLTQCGLCLSCRSMRDGSPSLDECASVLGGTCVLSPQDCACGTCATSH